MNKLSIGKHGIVVETHEKANVMSPFNQILWLLIPCFIILSFNSDHKTLIIYVICGFALLWGIIYTIHSFKNPELLQSEKYRLEQHRIEAGMIENKNDIKQKKQELLQTNIVPNLEESQNEDIE